METIAKEADIITLHVPLTKEGRFATYHLANQDFFNKLARKPWLVNSCRGAVHDTQALLQAKRDGRISELIVDCWEDEPNINTDLLALATIATPHIAGFSADGKANGTRMCLEQIERYFGLTIEKIKEVIPATPSNKQIDMDLFRDHRIEQAILHTFNPMTVDRALRESVDRFEWFRAHYNHPREFKAYEIVNAWQEEHEILNAIGFSRAIDHSA